MLGGCWCHHGVIGVVCMDIIKIHYTYVDIFQRISLKCSLKSAKAFQLFMKILAVLPFEKLRLKFLSKLNLTLFYNVENFVRLQVYILK